MKIVYRRRPATNIVLGVLVALSLSGSTAWAIGNLKAGDPLPAFSLPRADNPTKMHQLQQLLGRPSIVVFWRPGQELSKAALLDLQTIVRELGSTRFRVLGIDTAQSAPNVVVSAMDDMALTFPVVLDPDRDLYGKVGVIVAPTTLLLDADGVLKFVLPTRPPQYARLIRAHIRHLLGDIDEQQMEKDSEPTVSAFEHDRAAAWRMYNLGKKAQQSGDVSKARELYERSLSQYSALVESRCALGFLLLGSGDHQDAGMQFEFALAEQSTLPEALLGRAAVLARIGSSAEAEEILRGLLSRQSISMRTRYELGRIYHAQGQFERASEFFREALSVMFPEGADTAQRSP